MKFGFQMGHGMKGVVADLIKRVDSPTVILSPRNINTRGSMSLEDRLVRDASEFRDEGAGDILIDPQLYSLQEPSKSISGFAYWRAQAQAGSELRYALPELVELNRSAGASGLILPSRTAEKIDMAWVEEACSISNEGCRLSGGLLPVYATIALSADAVKDRRTLDMVVLAAERMESVDGFYVVCEHPGKRYLVDEPLWLVNVMVLVAGLKRMGKKVILGYGSHQMLLLQFSKCDVLCSGNFLNVRSFDTGTFSYREPGPSNRKNWYYAPHLLSEFKVQTLDLAWQLQTYGTSSPLTTIRSPYSEDPYGSVLFSGAMPSDANYSEGDSFRHYLLSLSLQCEELAKGSYDDLLAWYRAQLQTAEQIVGSLRSMGVFDGDRSFSEVFPTAYQALSAFDSEMGFVMRNVWDTI